MAKRVVKKTATATKSSPKTKTAVKTATNEPTTRKKTDTKVVRKTVETKKKGKGSGGKKATPPKGKSAVKVKIESGSKSVSDTSDMDKLDTIIYSKSRRESDIAGSMEGSLDKKKGTTWKVLKKDAKVEGDATNSGESRSKSHKDKSHESFLKKSAKQQISQGVDTQSISDELSKIMKKIEVKKVQSSKSPTELNRSSKHKQKITAKNQNFTLQRNPRARFSPFVDLFELAKKSEYNNSDIILAIIEIVMHREGYILPNSPKSNSFWEEIVQFNEFKKLFQFYRPETLKKYWRLLSYKNSFNQAIHVITKYRKFLDEKKPKLLTIIAGVQNLAVKAIKSFEDFIVNHHKYLTLGIPSDRDAVLSGKRRGRETKLFKGENYTDEIKKFLVKETTTSAVLLLEEKDEVKRLSQGLRVINSRENKKLFKFTEEDKFIFSCIDNVIQGICKEVKDVPKDLAINALKINTFNIPQTLEYLKRPHVAQNEKNTFNVSDDHVLKYMKDTNFFKELVESKGKESIENREYFLS